MPTTHIYDFGPKAMLSNGGLYIVNNKMKLPEIVASCLCVAVACRWL